MKRTRIAVFNPVVYIFLFFALSVQAQVKPRYNIIFISVDDMTDRLSMFGNNEVLTPNLNRLAARSMVFINNYVQYPLCSPSRTSYLLGWRPDKIGFTNDKTRPRTVIGPNVKFLPEYFKDSGYRIESYGKTLHHTFEADIAWNYFEPPERKEPSITSSFAAPVNSFKPTAVNWWIEDIPDSLDKEDGKEVRNFVRRVRHSKNEQPYFYCLGFHRPHNPFNPSLEYWNLYGDPSVQELLPINENGDFSNIKGNGSGPIILPNTPPNDRDDVPPIAFLGHPSFVSSDAEWKRTIHAYNAEVSEVDKRLGLLLDEMDRQNLWANTIVVFTSDHGQHLGEHEGTWRKSTLFDESVHVPLIVYVPGKKAGICSRLTESVDLYPTLAELCGLPPPPGMEGTSFAPLLDNPTLTWKQAAFSQVNRRDRTLGTIMGRSICTESFRYTSWGKGGEELYDHKKDPNEYYNLATNPFYATQLDKMREILANGWTKAVPPQSSTNLKMAATAQAYSVSTSTTSSTGLGLYPNPSKGMINVKYNSSKAGKIEVKAYNVIGAVVFRTEQAVKGNNNYSFDLSNLKTGIYYLELTNSGEQKQAQFTIDR